MSQEDPPDSGRITPTGPGPLVVLGVIGLFIGWGARDLAIHSGWFTPSVSWLAVLATWFVAAATAGTAYLTWRTVRDERHRLTAQQGLSRLVLGKTMARMGALVLGGCLGSAISNLGVGAANSDRLILRALLAAAGAAAGLAAGLLLEHACRVPPPEAGDLP
ncbi:MAG TPA: DUF3180 domain-containing protein [Marmoricola sp.]|nr:DUF3180 domain-containing protein [Marmoricola sp.]